MKIYQAILITTSYTIFDTDSKNIFFKFFLKIFQEILALPSLSSYFVRRKIEKGNLFLF